MLVSLAGHACRESAVSCAALMLAAFDSFLAAFTESRIFLLLCTSPLGQHSVSVLVAAALGKL